MMDDFLSNAICVFVFVLLWAIGKIVEPKMTINDREKLDLETQIKAKKTEINDTALAIGTAKKIMARKQAELDALKRQRHKGGMMVSDHAILRMLERHYAVDIEQVRQRILCEPVKNALKVGAKKIKHDGIEYILGKDTVITIIC